MKDSELLIPTNIVKSKRKSISLIIKNNGEFIVRAPLRTSEKHIFDFINQKSNWIISKRKEQLNNTIFTLSFNKQEQVNILGNDYDLIYNDISRVKLYENQVIIPNKDAKKKLITFLKKIAKDYISKRIGEISNLYNFSYNSIGISSAKTCWGSCGANNNLHFTYKLVLCPPEVVDYIIIHELCHTKIKNHSKQFWQLVEKYCPSYKIYDKWLKKNRAIIELI